MNRSNNLTDNQHRDSFIFYRSFHEAIEDMKNIDQLLLYRAIANYALSRTQPELNSRTSIVWKLIKPQIDANWKKFDSGNKGGAPKGNSNAAKGTKKAQKNNQKQPNVNDNVNVNENNNDNNNANNNPKRVEISVLGDTIPTIDDLKGYIADNRLSVDGDSFYDYYASNGWKMGRSQMVDWRAAVRSWSRKSDIETKTKQLTSNDDL